MKRRKTMTEKTHTGGCPCGAIHRVLPHVPVVDRHMWCWGHAHSTVIP